MIEKCTCPDTSQMTYDQIMEDVIRARKMCTDTVGKRWMCPTLLRNLNKADQKRAWQKRQAKKMKKEGYTPDQIAVASTKPRRTRGYVAQGVVGLDLSNL